MEPPKTLPKAYLPPNYGLDPSWRANTDVDNIVRLRELGYESFPVND